MGQFRGIAVFRRLGCQSQCKTALILPILNASTLRPAHRLRSRKKH